MKRAIGKGTSDSKQLSVTLIVRTPVESFSALEPPAPAVPPSGPLLCPHCRVPTAVSL